MKLNRLFLLIVIVYLQGCSSASYLLTLSEVTRPAVIKQKYGSTKIYRTSMRDSNKLYFEDNIIKIIWMPTNQQFNFRLYNKSKYPIKIIWDEASFVNSDNEAHHVIHAGIKYINKESSMVPTIIPPNTYINDLIIPSSAIIWEINGPFSGWKLAPIFPFDMNGKRMPEYLGSTYKIALPIEIQDIQCNYMFIFKVIKINTNED